jgi:hypothetical protein
MTVYRRKATIVASRASWNLLDVQDLSTPSLQDIGPDDLFTILDLILSPTQNSTVNQNSSSYDLSNYLFQFLHLLSKPNAQISKQPLQCLRNLLTIPLYLCNPVTFTNSTSITSPQTDLPAENQLLGADAVSATRAVPGIWTVWTYIAAAGSILLMCLVVIGVNSRIETPETSSIPFADLLVLARAHGTNGKEDGGNTAAHAKYDDLFDSVKKSGDDEGILRLACGVKVYLKTGNVALSH